MARVWVGQERAARQIVIINVKIVVDTTGKFTFKQYI